MKKLFVVIVLFALPIVAYLFFASGVHDFAKLPVLNQNVASLEGFTDLDGQELSLEENINIIGFYGENPMEYSGNAFNLNGKVYDDFYKFKDFQVVVLVPEGVEAEVKELKEQLKDITNPVKWKFVFGRPEQIKNFFDSLGTDLSLREDYSSPYVFIVDKDGYLRGRENDDDQGVLYGYDTRSVGELDDKMVDDVKVMLAEYRLALKKYNAENNQIK